MGDDSFPSIQYVPIHHDDGPGILQSLMALHGFLKQNAQDKQGNQYLQSNSPAPGVSNEGALAEWLKAQGGLETGARTTNLGADTGYRNALTQYMPQEYAIKQQGADAQTQEAGARALEANTQANWQGDTSARDWANVGTEQQVANQAGQYQQGELADRAAQNQAASEDRRSASTDKADTAKTGQIMGLLEHYMQRANSGIPLSPAEQGEYDQVKQEAFKRAGIQGQPQNATAKPDANAVPYNPPSQQKSQGQSRLSNAVSTSFSGGVPYNSFDPMNRVANDVENAYHYLSQPVDTHGNPVGKVAAHLPGLGDLPPDVYNYLHKTFSSSSNPSQMNNEASIPNIEPSHIFANQQDVDDTILHSPAALWMYKNGMGSPEWRAKVEAAIARQNQPYNSKRSK